MPEKVFEIKSAEDGGSDYEAEITGYFTTDDVDEANEIVEPTAFTDTMPRFMKNAALCFNHNLDNIVGQVLKYKIEEHGVWIKAGIHGLTQVARDAAALVKAKILKRMSFMYDIKKYEQDTDEGEPMRLTEVELYEVSIVTVPMNPAAIIETAKSKGIELNESTINALSHKGGGKSKKGVGRMPDELLQKEIDSSLNPVKGEVSSLKVDVGKLTDEIGKIVNLQKQMQEMHGREKTEQREFAEKLAGDFKDAVVKLTEAHSIHRNTVVYGNQPGGNIGLKKALHMPDNRLKRIYSSQVYGDVDDFRRLNDGILIADTLKCVQDEAYGRKPKAERMQTLSQYDELLMLAKAMDTATSTEGSQWLPTEYSRRLYEMVRLEQVIAPLFPSFAMTEAAQVLPVEGADVLATRATERTAVVSTKAETTEQTPGTANKTYTAEKLRGRVQWSGEANDDLVISLTDYIQMKVARSLARATDKAIISGDDAGGTAYDTGDTPGATDCRYCWNGLRQMVQSGNKIDMSTFSESKINSVRAKLGKYGKGPNDFFWLMSIVGYLMHCLDPDEMPSFRTVDKYGAQATVLTGELGKINGSPLVISEFVLDTYNAAGIYDGTTTTKTILLAVNRMAQMMGNYKTPSMEIIRDALYDVYDIVSYARKDFQCLYDATAENVVSLGYNISTS